MGRAPWKNRVLAQKFGSHFDLFPTVGASTGCVTELIRLHKTDKAMPKNTSTGIFELAI